MTPEALNQHSTLTVKDFSLAVESYRALENRSLENWGQLFEKFFENRPKLRQSEQSFCGVDSESGWPFIIYYDQETGRPLTRFEVSAGGRKGGRPVLNTVIDYSYGGVMNDKMVIVEHCGPDVETGSRYTHPITGKVIQNAQVVVTETRVADVDWQPGRKVGHTREVVTLGKWPGDEEGPRKMVVIERNVFVALKPRKPGDRFLTFVEAERVFPIEGYGIVVFANPDALEGKMGGRLTLKDPPPDLGLARVVKY